MLNSALLQSTTEYWVYESEQGRCAVCSSLSAHDVIHRIHESEPLLNLVGSVKCDYQPSTHRHYLFKNVCT